MRRGALLVVALTILAAVTLVVSSGAWAVTTTWAVHLDAGSSGEARAQVLPTAPAGVAAACNAPTTSKTINVSWNSVAHATTYSVYDSTTSSGGTYALAASGVTGTSWTSGTLSAGTNYWFKVLAKIGTNWSSARSSASGESTIDSSSPFCVQP